MTAEDSDESAEVDELSAATREERRLQAKLDAGTITEAEYARLTALRFGRDPADFSFADAADLYGLTEAELRAEMAWLSGDGG
jgi:hypothetical protein